MWLLFTLGLILWLTVELACVKLFSKVFKGDEWKRTIVFVMGGAVCFLLMIYLLRTISLE